MLGGGESLDSTASLRHARIIVAGFVAQRILSGGFSEPSVVLFTFARMAESVDAGDSKSPAAWQLASSSLAPGIELRRSLEKLHQAWWADW